MGNFKRENISTDFINHTHLKNTIENYICVKHCVKAVRIRSYSGLHFPAFTLNAERCGVSLIIESKCAKMWTRITPNRDTF